MAVASRRAAARRPGVQLDDQENDELESELLAERPTSVPQATQAMTPAAGIGTSTAGVGAAATALSPRGSSSGFMSPFSERADDASEGVRASAKLAASRSPSFAASLGVRARSSGRASPRSSDDPFDFDNLAGEVSEGRERSDSSFDPSLRTSPAS